MILVSGATGNVGRQLVAQLVDGGHAVRALSRDPEAARKRLPDGIDVAPLGDGTGPETAAALEGVTALFLNPAAFPGGSDALLREVRRAGVRRVVTLSSASVAWYEDDANAIAEHHRALEWSVEAAAPEWTHLRPGAFAANTLQWVGQIRAGGPVRGWYAQSRTTPVHEADTAAVAVRALVTDDLLGQAPVLTGPASVSFAEQARIIGEAIGRELRYEEVPAEEVRDAMVADGVPWDVAETLRGVFSEGVGQVPEISGEVERLTGHPARTFAEWAHDCADAFR